MKSICLVLAMTLIVASNVSAQPPAPTIKIECQVNYEFIRSYMAKNEKEPRLLAEGDYFAGDGLFITRHGIDLYPQRKETSNGYKVNLGAAVSSFLSNACAEDIVQVLSYINIHEFDATQNVFYVGKRDDQNLKKSKTRKVGDWTLSSWNNENKYKD
jgi:hypothetical protein